MNTYIGEKSNINIPTDGKLNQFGGKKYKKKTRRKRRRNRRKSRRGGNTSESHKRRMGRIAAINAKRTANKASITPKKRRGN